MRALLSKLRNSRARASFVGRRLSELLHVRMACEQVRDCFSQCPFPVPMNNSNSVGSRNVSFIEKFVYAVCRLVYGRADDVDL